MRVVLSTLKRIHSVVRRMTPEGVIARNVGESNQLPVPQEVCVSWKQDDSRSERKLIPTDEHFFENRLPGILTAFPEASVRAVPKTGDEESEVDGVGQALESRLEMALLRASAVVMGSELS